MLKKSLENKDHESAIKDLIRDDLKKNNKIDLNQTLKDLKRNGGKLIFGSEEVKLKDEKIKIKGGQYNQDNDGVISAFEDGLEIDKNFAECIAANFNQKSSTHSTLNLLKLKFQFNTLKDQMLLANEERGDWKFNKTSEDRVKCESSFSLNKFKMSGSKLIDEDLLVNKKIECKTSFDFVWNDARQEISIDNIDLNLEIKEKDLRYKITKKILASNIKDKKETHDYFLEQLVNKENYNKSTINRKSAFFASLSFFILSSVAFAVSAFFIPKSKNIKISETIESYLFMGSFVIFALSLATLFAYSVALVDSVKKCKSSVEELDIISDKELKKLDFNQTFNYFTNELKEELKDEYTNLILNKANKREKIQDKDLLSKLNQSKNETGYLTEEITKEIAKKHFEDNFLNFEDLPKTHLDKETAKPASSKSNVK